MLGLYERHITIDLILFADTGAEQPHTYRHIEDVQKWLGEHGLPDITVVKNVDRYGQRFSLEDECLRSGTLPSIAYGYKRCSQKHKIAPQDKFCNNYPPCQEVWHRGKKVVKFVGYDAGEERRRKNALKYDLGDRKYQKEYPLMDWGWTREDCIEAIRRAGLPLPGKSSCFFCPSMKQCEILSLKEQHPDLFQRAIALEQNAMPNLKSIKGLGRNWSWDEKFNQEEAAS